MAKVFPFNDLPFADLIVDAVYEGGPGGQLSGEAISKLLTGSGNMGGFRVSGRGDTKNWVVLFTTGEDPDWPDTLDLNTGQFVYFGDNKTPGHELHATSAGGNKVLRHAFSQLHAETGGRSVIPPFFVFRKYSTANSARSVQFKGLVVPGFPGLSSAEDLVAVWKTSNGERFQNYRSVFTILDTAVVSRTWISELSAGSPLSGSAPASWLKWRSTGKYSPLVSQQTTLIRSVSEQAPETALQEKILDSVWAHFRDTPIAFEAFAARVYQMTDRRVIIDAITRGVIDGGRDAVGRYLLGLAEDPVYAEFSLEAKCYRPCHHSDGPTTVGVREVSRLISRIRHRQFGVLVTTSAIARQAYEEVRQDRHPIIFISGRDISEILLKNEFNTEAKVEALLKTQYPV